jgi:hypothetical protein
VLPLFVPPIIGYHREEDVGHNDGDTLLAQGPARSRQQFPAPFRTDRGILIEGFYDLFWKDRVHIIDSSFDAGNVLSAVTNSFEIYNSGTRLGQHSRRQVTIISDLTSQGITITTGNTTVPFYLGLGQSEVYEYLISSDGVATISGSYDFTWNHGVVLQHFITGSRLLLFTFDPQEGYRETFEWRTDIIEKAGGSEQRISVRNIPRLVINHEFLFDDPETIIEFQNILYTRLPNRLGLPYWRDFVTLNAAVTAGDVVLSVSTTTNRDFRVGLNVALYDRDTNSFEVGEIAVVNTNQITLQAPLLQSWAAGVEVLPVLIAFVSTPYTQEHYPKDVLRTVLDFAVIQNKDFSSAAAYPTYKSTPVYDDPLLLESDDFTRDFDHGVIEFNNPVGIVHQDSWFDSPRVGWKRFTALFKNRNQYVDLRNFIHSRRGRQVAFYISTRQKDFLPANTNPGTPTQVDSTITGYSNVFALGHRIDAEIEFADGTINRREITNVIVTGSFEQLVFDSALSQEWSPSNVVRCSYLLKFRFDIDRFEFVHNWHNNGFITFALKEVKG